MSRLDKIIIQKVNLNVQNLLACDQMFPTKVLQDLYYFLLRLKLL